jgi:hypothetical protein
VIAEADVEGAAHQEDEEHHAEEEEEEQKVAQRQLLYVPSLFSPIMPCLTTLRNPIATPVSLLPVERKICW